MVTPNEIERAAEILSDGGCVAIPTETVYGLAADATDPTAIKRVFSLKGRPTHNPLIVHIADIEMARPLAGNWPDLAIDLANRFWPGPLTIVFPSSGRIPPEALAHGTTVAIRCPDHPVALDVIRTVGRPLVAPSANIFGSVSPTTPDHVRADFPDLYILDAGPCTVGIESTVISLAHDPPRILRPGAVTPEMLAIPLAEQPPDDPHLHSPGRLPSHYAPNSPARLVDTREIQGALASHTYPYAILHHTHFTIPSPNISIPMPSEAAAYAARLYAALRDADAQHPACILIESPPNDSSLWLAIIDRLTRATTPRSG